MNFEKFTQKSLEALKKAQDITLENKNTQIEQEHMLLSLLEDDNGLIKELFEKMNVGKELKSEIKKIIDNKPKFINKTNEQSIYISQDLEQALTEAEKTAKNMKDEYISVEHIMLGIFDKANNNIKNLFKTFDVTKDKFLKVLLKVRGRARVMNDNPEETYEVLKKYGSDLVELAKAQKLDPVIGRDDEIRNVIRILSRKTKNNPVLIGEPGVGKTAIAEGLALRIVRGDVPEGLKECTIFSLDMGALVAGAKYRGELRKVKEK